MFVPSREARRWAIGHVDGFKTMKGMTRSASPLNIISIRNLEIRGAVQCVVQITVELFFILSNTLT
jgi:hypothetical protein